jgi:hypothetical protein
VKSTSWFDITSILPQIHRGLKPIELERRDPLRRPFAVDAVISIRRARARELAKSSVATIIAASCNAASFARDARTLVDGGYRLTQVRSTSSVTPPCRDRGAVCAVTPCPD